MGKVTQGELMLAGSLEPTLIRRGCDSDDADDDDDDDEGVSRRDLGPLVGLGSDDAICVEALGT